MKKITSIIFLFFIIFQSFAFGGSISFQTNSDQETCAESVAAAVFDLTLNEDDFTGGSTTILVTYHTSIDNANNSVAIPNFTFYTPNSATEIIYVKLTDTINGTTTIDQFTISVNLNPNYTDIGTIEADNSNMSGTIFDLISNTSSSISSSDSVSYFSSETDLLNDANSINQLDFATNNLFEVWAKITDVNTGCFSYFAFYVYNISNASPVLEECNEDNPVGFANFNLTEIEPQLIANNTNNYTFDYFSDATYSTLIASPINYTNTTPFNETIYVEIKSNSFPNVTILESFSIMITGNPAILTTEGEEVYVCYQNDASVSTVDLSGVNMIVTNDSDYIVTYYYDEAFTSEITNWQNFPKSNFDNNYNDFPVYIQVENPITGCSSFTNILVKVSPEPLLEDELIQLCENEFPESNGVNLPFEYDLNTIMYEFLYNPEFEISFYDNLTDAQNETNAISGDVSFFLADFANPDNLDFYIKSKNIITYCENIKKVEFEIFQFTITPLLTSLSTCDNDGDLTTEVDLSLFLDYVSMTGYTLDDFTISYHTTNADAHDLSSLGVYPKYVDVSNGETTYIRFIHKETGCFDVTSYTHEITSPSIEFDPTPVCFPTIYANENNQTGGPTAPNGPDYDCLGSEPFPKFFYLEVDNSGYIEINISQFSNADQTGTELDVDFILWGPYDHYQEPACNGFNDVVACSYSPSNDETFDFVGQTGEFYILMVTNYSQNPGWIQIEQIGGGGDFVCNYGPGLENEVLLCDEDSKTLQTPLTYFEGVDVTFQWFFNNSTIPGATNSDLTVTETGEYKVEVYNDDNDQIGEFEFDVEFYNSAIFNSIEDQIICNNDGFNNFDFSGEITDNILASLDASLDPDLYQISFHGTEDGALNNSAQLPLNYFNNLEFSEETIWIRVMVLDPDRPNSDFNLLNCITVDSFKINVYEEIENGDLEDIVMCDNDVVGTSFDGIHEFDLTIKITEILENNTYLHFPEVFSFSFYTQPDFDPSSIITNTSNFQNTIPIEQTIYVLGEQENSPCPLETSFTIFVNPLPEIIDVETLEICDDTTDGIANVDLTVYEATFTENGLHQIVYHETLASAEGLDDAIITNPTDFATATTTIYYTLINPNTDCGNLGSFEVEVLPFPVVEPLYEKRLCDDFPIDNHAIFNLQEIEFEIANGNTFLDIVFYENYDSALNQLSNPITNISTYNSNTKVIYAQVTSTISTCNTVTEVHLFVDPAPILNENVSNYVICDDDYDGFGLFSLVIKEDEILSLMEDTSDLIVTYHESEADALVGVSPITGINLVNFQNQTPNIDQIWVRVEAIEGDCFDITNFYIVVDPKPLINEVNNIEQCNDGDGYVVFDLTNNVTTEEILNEQQGISITYFTDLNEANLAVDDQFNGNVDSFAFISSPENFENTITPVQTIYAVLKNTVSGCGTVTPFNVEVLPLPPVPEILDFEVCDDDVNDGLTSINLNEADAYHTFDTEGFTVSYHHSEQEAIDNENAISSPYENTIPSNFSVYVRIENDITHCVSITTMNVHINNSPITKNPSPLEACDVNSDGFTIFNLTLKDSHITDQLGQVEITYFEEYIDAFEEVYLDAIQNPEAYPNIDINNQIIYALVKNIITGCTKIVPLELIVNPTPFVIEPEPLEVCDDEIEDGITAFDLTVYEDELVTELDVTFEYYYTEEAAIEGNTTDTTLGVGFIVNPAAFVNLTNPQTIWIRGEFSETNCGNVVPLTLKVNSVPIPTQPEPYELCDNDEDGDSTNGFVEGFLLYEKDAEILGGTTGVVTYHEGAVDGPVIDKLSVYTNITAGSQAVYAVVTNTETGCNAYVVLDLIVNPLPAVEELTIFEACDDDYDGYAIFDLNEVSTILDPFEEYDISYHYTQQNADEGTPMLPDLYYSVASTIYVRIENLDTGCFITQPLQLVLSEKPSISPLEDFVLCDDDTDGFAIFNLSVIRDGILSDNPLLTITMYLSEEDAEAIEDPIDIDSPFLNTIANQQTIWIRVENGGGCYIVESIELIIEQMPNIGDPNNELIICDDDYDGIASFDLTQRNDHYLVGQLGMVVTYHTTQENAEGDIVDIPDFTNFVNTTANAQELYVRVENQTTGCYAISSLTLVVEPLPKPNLTPEPLEVCDDNTDGVASFDLTSKIPELLNNQNPTSMSFLFFENESDIDSVEDDSTLAIADADLATYISSSTTIYVKITNENTEMKCFVIVPLELIVNALPEFENIEDNTYYFCESDGDGMMSVDVTEMTDAILSDTSSL
uniref:hypothetical protein n=1 Tax=Aureivirga marina TaxID=1182451 RepID=UPI0018C9550F